MFFVLGAILYYLAPRTGVSGLNSIPLFVTICGVILTMYGGGFATIPAYLRDLFGTMEVGAIHGRLLTAWSVAGICGPVLVNYIREYEKSHGVPLADSYSTVLYVMVALLVVGFCANAAVRPVHARHWDKAEEDKQDGNRLAVGLKGEILRNGAQMDQNKKTPVVLVILAWLFVGLPWGWGVTQLWKNVRKLFQSPPATHTSSVSSSTAAPAAPTSK